MDKTKKFIHKFPFYLQYGDDQFRNFLKKDFIT